MNRFNVLAASAAVLAVLGSGCATVQRPGAAQVGGGEPPAAQSAAAQAAKPRQPTGLSVPSWWETPAVQSGDVMGVR